MSVGVVITYVCLGVSIDTLIKRVGLTVQAKQSVWRIDALAFSDPSLTGAWPRRPWVGARTYLVGRSPCSVLLRCRLGPLPRCQSFGAPRNARAPTLVGALELFTLARVSFVGTVPIIVRWTDANIC